MSIKSKIATAVAIATLAGSIAIPTSSAQAGYKGWGIGAGLVGAAVVGSAIAASSAPYGGYYVVDGVRRCGWERQYDRFGNYMGTVKVCRVY